MTETTTARTIPEIPGYPLVGMLPHIMRQGLMPVVEALRQQHGDVFSFTIGGARLTYFLNPAHIGHIYVDNNHNYRKGQAYDGLRVLMGQGLVTSEGAFWKRQRRITQPHFTPRSVTHFAPLMLTATENLLNRWQAHATNGQPLPIGQEMMRLTLAIIGLAMFNIDLSETALETGQAFNLIFRYVGEGVTQPFRPPLSWPTPGNQRVKKAVAEVRRFISNRLERARAGEEVGDLLRALLNARDSETGEGMTEAQLYDEMNTLFFAGYETTARTLAWAWYLLTQHPDKLTQLQAEVDAVLGTGPTRRTLTLEDIPALVYTRCVAEETLRLYPATHQLARQANVDDVVGGYTVPKDMMLLVSPAILHHRADIWDNPAEFRPERFHPDQAQKLPKHAYIPFATGPRVCIGNSFAMQEIIIALALTAHRYHLARPPREVAALYLGTTTPAEEIFVNVTPRW